MIADADRYARHFQIGAVGVTLTTPIRSLRSEYSALYAAFRVEEPPKDAIRVDARFQPFSLRHRRRCTITINDRLQFEPDRSAEYLPYVEWAINWEIPRAMPRFLQLHASSMEINGAGVIFPGESGSGKSTLTAGLLTRGWNYLCDEFALIDSNTLMLHPYPRAVCVKRPSFPVVESLGLRLHGRRRYIKGFKGWVRFISPLEVRGDAVGRSCPIRYVIFPKYTTGASPVPIPMTRAEAALELHRVCFNLFGCERLALTVIAGLIRGAECFRLISGEIHATCDVVESLVTLSRHCVAKSA